jgi:enoyl-CoA hydratase
MADKPDKVKPDFKKLKEEAKPFITYEKDRKNRIATITFRRPDQLNATNIGMRQLYADMIHKANVDDEVKVLLIRGEGKDFGGGGDLPEQRDMLENPGTPLLHELSIDDPDVVYPPGGSYRYLFTLTDHYSKTRAGNRPLQEFKKISIVETKGYCYGWHFYQAGDADLVVSSDDTLFGHPSFRYAGWGPRMWTWIETMGLRKFQEMVFTGRPFSAKEMYDCGFVNSVVPRDKLEEEVMKYALACSRSRPTDTVVAQKTFFELYKQYRGEYFGSLLTGWLEGLLPLMSPDSETDVQLSEGTFDKGLNNVVKDNDMDFPPDWRLSRSGRKKP